MLPSYWAPFLQAKMSHEARMLMTKSSWTLEWQAKKIDDAVQVHADIAGIGFSLNTPEAEVLYMLLDDIRVRATSSKVSRTLETCIRNIQASCSALHIVQCCMHSIATCCAPFALLPCECMQHERPGIFSAWILLGCISESKESLCSPPLCP